MLADPVGDLADRRRPVGLRDEVGRHAGARGHRRGVVWATSRAGNDATARFPELARTRSALGDVDALLDGELVALDEAGIPRFERLQPRMQAGRPPRSRQRAAEQPVAYMVFDVLWLDGHSTCELPYTDRRALLERLALGATAGRHHPRTVGGGSGVLAASQRLGLEGVVAKRLDSHYLPGKRADAWRKVKPTQGQELVVGGWLPGAGRLEGTARLAARRVPRARRRCPGRCDSRGGSAPGSMRPSALRSIARLGPLRRAISPFDTDAASPGSRVGRTRGRGRGRVPRVDERRRTARAAIPRAARRQARG